MLQIFGEVPRHVAVVAMVAAWGCMLINQSDGFGVNPEGARDELQGGGGGWLQVLEDLELGVYPYEFCGGGGF